MRRALWIGLICGTVLPVVSLALLSLFARKPTNLGVREGRLAACPNTPNCVSSQADDATHRVEPLAFADSPITAWERLRTTLRAMPRAKLVTDDGTYLHAEFTSALFRFVDDVEFVIDEPVQVIHVRSASRVGRADFGVNRKRVEELRARFTETTAP